MISAPSTPLPQALGMTLVTIALPPLPGSVYKPKAARPDSAYKVGFVTDVYSNHCWPCNLGEDAREMVLEEKNCASYGTDRTPTTTTTNEPATTTTNRKRTQWKNPNSGFKRCYNREHSFPKAWWGHNDNGKASDHIAAYADLFHLFPADS